MPRHDSLTKTKATKGAGRVATVGASGVGWKNEGYDGCCSESLGMCGMDA